MFKKKLTSSLNLTPADYLLFRACKTGDVQLTQQALAQLARPNARGPEKETPLCVASFHGHPQICRILICCGANVNVSDKFRGTPLHLAAFNGHTETVLTLLAMKANPRAKNQRNQYPYEVASNDTIATILRHFNPKKGRTLLHFACEKGNLALVEWLIRGKFGNIVTAWDRDLNAPLHIAASKGFYDICKVLLMAGADRNLYNRGKQQPIDVAKTEEVRHLLTTYEHHKAAREIEAERERLAKEMAEQHQEEEDDEESDEESFEEEVEDEVKAQLASSPFVDHEPKGDLISFDDFDQPSQQMYGTYANTNYQQHHQQAQAAQAQQVNESPKSRRNRPNTWNLGAAPQFNPFGDAFVAPNAQMPMSQQAQETQQAPPVQQHTSPPVTASVKSPRKPAADSKLSNAGQIAALKTIETLKKNKRAARKSWSPFDGTPNLEE